MRSGSVDGTQPIGEAQARVQARVQLQLKARVLERADPQLMEAKVRVRVSREVRV